MKFRLSTMPPIATPIVLMAAASLFAPYPADAATTRATMPMTRQAEIVPKPASWALLATGFGALGATLRKRRLDAGKI